MLKKALEALTIARDVMRYHNDVDGKNYRFIVETIIEIHAELKKQERMEKEMRGL